MSTTEAAFSWNLDDTPEPPAEQWTPPVPENMDQAGLTSTLLEQLILKMLYFEGELQGHDIAFHLGLKFSVIESVLDFLKRTRMVEVKRSSGFGNVSAIFALSDAGRNRTGEYLDINQYAGRAPVPIEQYTVGVREQRPKEGWLTKDSLAQAFSHMVVPDLVLTKVGPAVNSGQSFLIFGQPGNGKSYLAQALNHIEASSIYVPYAIEVQGQIIEMFDALYHHPEEEEVAEEQQSSVSVDPKHDRRWIRCERPFIVTGGELTLDMLDLSYKPSAKVYGAPFQLKSNNGIYLIDDFGRQRVQPAELLNRWIIPMDSHVDYLTFHTGGKVRVPFETFLIFSTNLHPAKLGDEAFLRRIQYKMYMKNPSEQEFIEIFERYCASVNLEYTRDLIDRFVDRHYRKTGKPFRRCHPRDVVTHALHLMRFEHLRTELDDDTLDRAFESCFLEENEINEP